MGDHAHLAAQLAKLSGAMSSQLLGKSLFLTQQASEAELDHIFAVARSFEAMDRAGVKTPLLDGELAYAVFFDNSTRTKSAWAGAAARLGMSPVIVDGSSTQVAHGETAEETGAMLGMNAHALGIRHDLILGAGNSFMRDVAKGISDYLLATGNSRKVPVVNLQCDVDHPTQVLADLMWLQERFPDGLAGKKIAVSWAYSPSYAKPLSVPQGLASLMTRTGAHVRLAYPPGYRLMGDVMQLADANARAAGGSFEIVDSMDAAFTGADVVYPKSWGPHDLMLERVAANRAGDPDELRSIERFSLERNARYTDWICDEERMSKTAGGDALYMHCLPADIGAEVSASVLERHRVNLAQEANKKIYIISALLAVSKVENLPERLRGLLAGDDGP